MTGRSRSLVLVVAALGALATCLALPMVDPACTASSMSVPGSLGCAAASMSGPRAAMPVALAVAVTMGFGMLASILLQAVAHHRMSQALRRTSRPSTLGGQPVGVVPGMAAACVAGIRRPAIYCSPDLTSRL